MEIVDKIEKLHQALPTSVKVLAVSKRQPIARIREAYEAGHRSFGENRPQELVAKYEELPKDIEWHLIGQLQRNKVKHIAPFVHLIHSLDREELLPVLEKEAMKHERHLGCLFQVKIAEEASKTGWLPDKLERFWNKGELKKFPHVRPCGLMGMATYTTNKEQIRQEFRLLRQLFERLRQTKLSTPHFSVLSMGMSNDYDIAVEEGSTLVRVGSIIFGERL